MTQTDFKRLVHMVGGLAPKKDWGYRNFYAARKDGSEVAEFRQLVSEGLVTEGRESGNIIFFHATEAGCRVVGLTDEQIKKALEP